MDWLTGLLLSLAAGAAWLVRSFFAERKEQKLTQERDNAKVQADVAHIAAIAKGQEVAKLKQQQKTEGEIRAKVDPNTRVARANNMFK